MQRSQRLLLRWGEVGSRDAKWQKHDLAAQQAHLQAFHGSSRTSNLHGRLND